MDVREDVEENTLWVTTPKREKKIKIFIPKFSNNNFWQVLYEDGNKIPEIEGFFTTRTQALRAVESWERDTKVSDAKYKSDNWGHKTPPVLKRKKVKGSASASSSEAD